MMTSQTTLTKAEMMAAIDRAIAEKNSTKPAKKIKREPGKPRPVKKGLILIDWQTKETIFTAPISAKVAAMKFAKHPRYGAPVVKLGEGPISLPEFCRAPYEVQEAVIKDLGDKGKELMKLIKAEHKAKRLHISTYDRFVRSWKAVAA